MTIRKENVPPEVKTKEHQESLARLSRRFDRHLRFQRHSPRDERWVPFEETVDTTTDMIGNPILESIIWVLVFIIFAVFCFTVLGLEVGQ